jgi:DNA processing protein
MLDLRTAGMLAFLPLSLHNDLFSRLLDDSPLDRPHGRLGRVDHGAALDLSTLRSALSDLLDDPHRAAALLDAAGAAADRAFTSAAREGIRPIPFGAPEYPFLLPRIVDPPPLLWARGDPGFLSLSPVAIVGSRAASPSGLEVAHRLAADLADQGVIVVSGLARGVDSAAHRGALTRGATVAILGSGADIIYPAEHAALATQIIENGLVLSELPPGAPPRPHHFPRRNRLISGVSLAVVVIEASIRSGSLQTARLALEQGKEVMAVPGTIIGERNRGSHGLIRDGAKLVECVSDILDELRLPWSGDTAGLQASAEPPAGLEAMPIGEAHDFQTLVSMTGLTNGELLRQLLRAEASGYVVRTPGSRFLRVGRPVVR